MSPVDNHDRSAGVLHQGQGCANGCNAPFGVRCSACNTVNRAEQPSEMTALFRARVLSEHGTWVDGALWRHRDDAEGEARDLAESFGTETQVVDEFPAIPHPIAAEIDRLQRRNAFLESENDDLHDDVVTLLRRVEGAS